MQLFYAPRTFLNPSGRMKSPRRIFSADRKLSPGEGSMRSSDNSRSQIISGGPAAPRNPLIT
jgi:hypothetical protein